MTALVIILTIVLGSLASIALDKHARDNGWGGA